MDFPADELGGAEEVSVVRSAQNGSRIQDLLFTLGGRRWLRKNVANFRGNRWIQAATPWVAASSPSIHVLQRQLKEAHAALNKGGYIRNTPDEGGRDMFMTKQHLVTARRLGVAIVAIAGLASCATYKEEFAGINSRLDQLDTKVQGAAQSAESANQSAQQANQRLDQIEGRVRQLEQAPPRRTPRG